MSGEHSSPTLATNAMPAPGEELRRRGRSLGWFALALALGFALPLFDLIRFAMAESFYSHVIMIPAISLYLAWTLKDKLRASFPPAKAIAVVSGGLGLLFLGGYWAAIGSGWNPRVNDRLFVMVLAFVCGVWSGSAWLLGRENLRVMAFPLGFLLFMAPLPVSWHNAVEVFLQHASAEMAYFLIKLLGTPIFREATLFTLPGVQLEVAPECSGIRSSLVLFIVGILAGHFFLAKSWAKVVLAIGVVGLGILRNAVRITVLAQLAVHVDPGIIDSALHRRGGPVFFAVSLIPFFVLIWFLRKAETRKPRQPSATV